MYTYYDGEDYGAMETEYQMRILPEIIIPELTADGEYEVNITVPDAFKDLISIQFNGKTYDPTFVKGKYRIILSDLTSGVYDMEVKITDEYGYSLMEYTITNVFVKESGDNYNFTTDFSDEYLFNSTVIKYCYLPVGATGNVTVFIDNKEYGKFNITYDEEKGFNSEIWIEFKNLTVGQHKIEFNYSGDGYFKSSNITKLFNISYITIPEEIKAGDFNDTNTNSYYLDVYEGLTGAIILLVDDVEIARGFNNGLFTFDLNNITSGLHTYEIRYLGNDEYKNFTKKGTFNVNYSFNIHTDTVRYGEDALINIELPSDATGEVTLSINNENLTKQIINGWANFTIPDLDIGKYQFSVKYAGDEKYYSNIKNETLEVVYGVLVKVDNDKVTISIDLNDDVEGELDIELDDYEHEINIIHGKASYTIYNLKGEHYIYARAYVDGYDILKFNDVVLLSDSNYSLDIDLPRRVILNSDDNITVTINSDGVKGNLTVYLLNGEEKIVFANYTNADGKVIVSLSKLTKLGIYDFGFEFKSESTTLYDDDWTVLVAPKITYPYEITVGDDEVLSIELPEDAEGNVIFNIIQLNDDYSKEFNQTLIQGKTEFSLSQLKAGNYWIVINYNNDKYGTFQGHAKDINLFYYEADLTVKKPLPQASAFNSTDELIIKFDDNVTGSVIVNVNGKDYLKPIVNGIVQINDIDLSETSNVSITYSGDGNYSSFKYNVVKINTTPQEITPIDPELSINVDNITVGQNAIIYIYINKNIISGVNVTINDNIYPVTFNNGVGNVTVCDLSNGAYEVKAIFEGNEFFTPSQKTTTLKVSKLTNPLTITVKPEYLIESNFTILISNVTPANVTINNEVYNVVDGKVIIDTTSLKEGEYTVKANVSETAMYLSNSTTATFKIIKYDAGLTVTASDINFGEIANVKISINENATGMVVYSINGTNKTVEIEKGEGNITLGGLDSGNYQILVSFIGDEKYAASQKTATFNVIAPAPTYDPKIVANDLTTQYTSGALFTVQVYGTDGNVARGVSVEFRVNNAVVATSTSDANGRASFKTTQIPGKYTVTATALGVTSYNKLTVSKIITLKSVSVKKSAKKVTIQATLKKVNGKVLKNKKLTFKFNGKKYSAKTNSKGVAKVTIKKAVLKKLKVGKKITYQAIYLKETASKVVKVKK